MTGSCAYYNLCQNSFFINKNELAEIVSINDNNTFIHIAIISCTHISVLVISFVSINGFNFRKLAIKYINKDM